MNEFDSIKRSRARIGAHALHSQRDSREITMRAREKFLSRFEEQVDPRGELDPRERANRVAHAKAAYFGRLGMLSGKARRRAT